jgi:hypothetical protein
MAKITFEMVKEIYAVWEKIDNGEITRHEGIKMLYRKFPDNGKTPENYYNNLRYLKKGKRYSPQMKPLDTLYFLSQIYKNYGEEIYQNALSALRQHIGQYNTSVEPLHTVLIAKKLEINDPALSTENGLMNAISKVNISPESYANHVDNAFSEEKIPITTEMIKQCYIAWKKIYNGEISRIDGIKKLHNDFDWKENVAAGHINNLKHLCNGEEYKFIMKESDTDYYISQLKNDYGDDVYQNTLLARKKHDEFRIWLKKYQNEKNKNQRTVKITNRVHPDSTPATSKNNSFSASYEMIVREAKELIRLINQNCRNLGKEPIFKDGLFELWIDIEKTCSSKNDFEVFSSSLYKLVIENPRDANPNSKKNGGYFYEYRYSEYSNEFWKNGTITKDFIDDVKTIRHEFAHTKLVKKVPVKTKAEVLQKYLGSSIEPRLPEKYQEFQFGILKEFESFLNKLLEMVEKYKSPLQTP